MSVSPKTSSPLSPSSSAREQEQPRQVPPAVPAPKAGEAAGPTPPANASTPRVSPRREPPAPRTLPEGVIALRPPAAAGGRFAVRLRDSVPIVGLFETRKNLPRWIERVLTVPDLAATGAFAYRDRDFALDEFETRFRKATIRAKARFG